MPLSVSCTRCFPCTISSKPERRFCGAEACSQAAGGISGFRSRFWLPDVTYVATWSGFAYVAFVTDVYSRRIFGWNVAATLNADFLPLQALNMAARAAGGNLDGLVHDADHGSNYLPVVYTDRIVELGAVRSTGTVGDSYDNALAEAADGLYKTELIRRRGPMANRRASRTRHPRVRVVVGQPALARRTRPAHPDRGRAGLLR